MQLTGAGLMICLKTLALSWLADAIVPKEATILSDGSIMPSSHQVEPSRGKTLLQHGELDHAADSLNASELSKLAVDISTVLGFNPQNISGKCAALFTKNGGEKRYLSACLLTTKTMVWQSQIYGDCEKWCVQKDQSERAVLIYHRVNDVKMQLDSCNQFMATRAYDEAPTGGPCQTFSFIPSKMSSGHFLRDNSMTVLRYIGFRSDEVARSWDRWLKGTTPGKPIQGCTPGCGLVSDSPDPVEMYTWYAEEVECPVSLCHEPKPCAWLEWSQWSTCTKTCDTGSRLRTRKKKAEEKFGGPPCSGEPEEEEKCEPQGCPEDCIVSEWGQWSSHCSKTCGGGIKVRNRVIQKDANYGGAPCPDESKLQEEIVCNTAPCKVDCEMAEWSKWSACTKTCACGHRTRSRAVKVKAARGGASCPAKEAKQSCNTQRCPIDCVLGGWTDWGPCSATCLGQQERHVSIHVKPANGGKPCDGARSTEKLTQKCGWESCPVTSEAEVQKAAAAKEDPPDDSEEPKALQWVERLAER